MIYGLKMKGFTALEAVATMDFCLLETSFVRAQNVSPLRQDLVSIFIGCNPIKVVSGAICLYLVS